MAFEFLNKLSNLQQRLIAGILGALIMVSLICSNEWTYFALFLTISILALREFYNLLQSAGYNPSKNFGLVSGVALFTLVFLIEKQIIPFHFYYLLFPFVFIVFLIELFQKKAQPFINIAFTFLGVIYVALPFALLHVSAFIGGGYNYKIVFSIVLLLWANDVGAYFAGRSMGKNLLFPTISPKKTWEGAIGGAVLCLLTAVGLNAVFLHTLFLWQWLVLALIISVAGSYGDLIESMFKRSLSLKDSAQVIPGHGGFLDRFDSFLLVSPFVAAFLKIIMI